MGYTITVTLDLWCGNKAHRFPYHGQFEGSTPAECRKKAKKKGWAISNPKGLNYDRKGSGQARCPMCAKGEAVI